MGRRGPPAKPTALKKLHGTYRKDRAVENEMSPPVEAPDRPDWLDAEGKREWDRVVPILLMQGTIAKIDGSILAHYCAAHSLSVKAARQYQKEGAVLKTPFGIQKHPMIDVATKARAQARLFAAEFGLSTASRTRISIPEQQKEQDATENFLFGPLKVVDGGDNK